MTLNDLELLEIPFYVKFSVLRTNFERYYLLIYYSLLSYTRDQLRCAEAE